MAQQSYKPYTWLLTCTAAAHDWMTPSTRAPSCRPCTCAACFLYSTTNVPRPQHQAGLGLSCWLQRTAVHGLPIRLEELQLPDNQNSVAQLPGDQRPARMFCFVLISDFFWNHAADGPPGAGCAGTAGPADPSGQLLLQLPAPTPVPGLTGTCTGHSDPAPRLGGMLVRKGPKHVITR